MWGGKVGKIWSNERKRIEEKKRKEIRRMRGVRYVR